MPGYSSGLSPLPSCGVASSRCEDADAPSLRPLACDFRRLRFSRSASFSRSCRESGLGLFAAGPARLSCSSVIVDPSKSIALP